VSSITFGEKLKEIREGMELSQEAFGKLLGTTKQVISRYENDQRAPKITVAQKYSEILNVHLNFLIDDDTSISRFGEFTLYTAGGNKDNVRAPKRVQKVITALPLYNLPVSAGSGEWVMEGCEYEYVEFDDVPKDAEFALRVRGDSMVPMFDDGDIVFIKSQLHVLPWQAGVFYHNGAGYLKMVHGNQLVSCNSNYEPIVIGEFDSFFTLGRVVGKA